MFFKGAWSSKFKKSETRNGNYTSLDGVKVTKEFMNQTFEGYYFHNDDGTEYCCLPFGNGAYRMKFIMPKEGSDFKEYVKSLTYEKMTRFESLSSVNGVDFTSKI